MGEYEGAYEGNGERYRENIGGASSPSLPRQTAGAEGGVDGKSLVGLLHPRAFTCEV